MTKVILAQKMKSPISNRGALTPPPPPLRVGFHGVGMDVVRTKIELIGGIVDVKSETGSSISTSFTTQAP